MKRSWRLPDGGVIDREKSLHFKFNGRTLHGYEGDTLASALLANGVHFTSRSFKFHRPRGIFSAGEEEPNALLEVGTGARRDPSCRAPQVLLTDGLIAHSQNGWPALGFDLARVLDYTHALWPAGFYNKIFKWPDWRTWEGLVRHMSGLGRAPDMADPDCYEQVNAHCDLLVCGGGPAGLMAALVAGRAGLKVILADQDRQLGGALNWERYVLDGLPASHWIIEVVRELEDLPGVTLLRQTTVSGNYDHNVTTLVQRGPGTNWRECFWTVRPRRIVLATGAIEQGLVFANNDRPGIMLAGAIRHYLNRYAVIAGRNTVIATNNDTAYQTVVDLCRRGLQVSAVIDSRPAVRDAISEHTAALGVRLFTGAKVRNTRGTRRLKGVSVETLSGQLQAQLPCDLLGVSGGWSPRVHLLCHARGSLRFSPASQNFLPDRLPEGFHVLGSVAGQAKLSEILSDVVPEVIALCKDLGFTAHLAHQPPVAERITEAPEAGVVPLKACAKRQWIDLAHDVTFGDAELAVREGFESVELFKRYTTTGMSVDQGKTGNLNAFLALSALTGQPIEEIGTTTFRPPYMPVTLGAIAGRSRGEFYAARRYLPAHRVHQVLQATFEDYGGWQRPDYYALRGESAEDSIQREVRAVRSGVGVFDNSPIGKIEVRGPDAAEFLNRFYINQVPTLPSGRVRYGLMLNENGVIVDDGVFCRLAENHFLVNTTSAGVAHIVSGFEEWLQCEWPELRVLINDVTTQWANFTFAGPRARELLQSLDGTIDFSAGALPHMALAAGQLTGLDVRIVRVSFSGEPSFEVNLPANRASSFLAGILQTGEKLNLTPYGIEALMILRLEKGYLHVGSDSDGQTTPDDVGWGQVARNKQADFIGRRSLSRPGNLDPDRRQLVGLLAVKKGQAIRPGGHLLLGEKRDAPAESDGWITSAAFSPTLGHYVALGMLRNGRALEGKVVTVIDEKDRYILKVAGTAFFDPGNERLSA